MFTVRLHWVFHYGIATATKWRWLGHAESIQTNADLATNDEPFD